VRIRPRFPRLRLPGWVWAALIVLAMLLLAQLVRQLLNPRNRPFVRWFSRPEERAGLVTLQREACPGAAFVLPADGFIGLLYGDPRPPYSAIHRHQGIDIFVEDEPGQAPVVAAYDGYLTREPDWISSVIIRHPQDPLDPSRQVWTYYSHMADAEGNSFIHAAFPPGTREVFVEQGTLLGYVGNYSGNPGRPVGVHLHFSLVRDDGNGHYTNELLFGNTLDPSPYLGMTLTYAAVTKWPVECDRTPD
jgi:murein DD-endopeptidase MepM/ murein hydrolase activator NlpD